MIVFTVLHGMQIRSSDAKAVCLSFCPSVKHVDCDITEK